MPVTGYWEKWHSSLLADDDDFAFVASSERYQAIWRWRERLNGHERNGVLRAHTGGDPIADFNTVCTGFQYDVSADHVEIITDRPDVQISATRNARCFENRVRNFGRV